MLTLDAERARNGIEREKAEKDSRLDAELGHDHLDPTSPCGP